MRKTWGEAVGRVWGHNGQVAGLYPAVMVVSNAPMGITRALCAVFTSKARVVSHSSFGAFTAVNSVVTPTFHSTYKDNYKVYKLVIS